MRPFALPPYNGRRPRWTGKLGSLGEDQEPAFLDQGAILNELIALGNDIGIGLGRWALLQDGGGAVEYDEAIRRALATRLGSLDAAEEHATRRGVRGGLSNRRENVGTEDRQELPNAG